MGYWWLGIWLVLVAPQDGLVAPGSRVSSTIRTFSEAAQRRRRWTEVMTSMRSEGWVIDTIVCLTLAKWETVSGPFGGYLTHHGPNFTLLTRGRVV